MSKEISVFDKELLDPIGDLKKIWRRTDLPRKDKLFLSISVFSQAPISIYQVGKMEQMINDLRVKVKEGTPILPQESLILELQRNIEQLTRHEANWSEVVLDLEEYIEKLKRNNQKWFNGAMRGGSIGDVS